MQFVRQGGALVMRPRVLHSLTKLKSGKRRVLHFYLAQTMRSGQMLYKKGKNYRTLES